MKGKKRFIALLLSFLMVLSQMSVATFALDTVADEKTDQTVEEQAAEETQPEADMKTTAVETEPAATEPAAEETATEPEAVEPAAEEPAEAAPAEAAPTKTAAKKAAPAKAAAKKAEPEKAEEEKAEAFDQSQTVDGVTVNVSAAKGVFPAGSKLSVSKISVPDAVDTSDAEAAYAFDISILANGKKIQPDGKATVSFTTAEVADYDTAVYHMDGGAQKMNVSESGDTATVTTNGFSDYVVLFKPVVNGKEAKRISIQLDLGDTITLNEILEKMNVATKYAGTEDYRLVTSFVGVNEDKNLQLLVNGEMPSGKISGNYTCDELSFRADTAGEGKKTLRLLVNPDDDPSGSIYDQTRIEFEYVIGEKRTVTFDLNGGNIDGETTVDPQYVPDGEKAADPGDPTKANRSFRGWFYKDGSEEKQFDFENDTVTSDIKLTARWHKHAWDPKSDPATRSDDKTTITYKCKGTPLPCVPHGEKEFTAKLVAKDITYSGSPYSDTNIALELSDGFPEECVVVMDSVQQWKQGSTVLDEAPTDAGTYTVQVKLSSDGRDRYLWDDFEIKKADPEFTAPTGKTLTYNGSAQELVTAGSTEDGTMMYALVGKDEEPGENDWSEDIPKGTDFGTYYVWYKVVGDNNHNDTTPAFVTALINKADPEVTAPTGKTLTYNGSAQELVSAGKTTGGEMQYALGKDAATAPEGGWSASLPKGTEVGKYYVWYKVVGGDNYNDTEPACVTSEIVARQFTITYDLNGGKLNGQTGAVTMTVEEGTVITLPAPTRDGYTFDYWEGSKYNAGDKYTVTGDHTFKAVWKTAGSGKKGKGAKTGDTNDIAGLLALMFASAGALGAIGYRRRREDQ